MTAQEIGIRTALGAQRFHVLGMILRQGMSLALIGIGLGIVLSLLLFRGLSAVLYGVKSTDLITLTAVSAMLLAVAFVASYVPALRVTRVDPVVALREHDITPNGLSSPISRASYNAIARVRAIRNLATVHLNFRMADY
jgi:ABC-type lipoprotein release transport system permease subunit